MPKLLMPMEIDLLTWFGLDYFVSPNKRFYWPYLLLSLGVALAYLWLTRQPVSAKLYSKKIWWHASARLDYLYFMVSALIKLALIIPLIISVNEVAFAVFSLLQKFFGQQLVMSVDHTLLMLFYTLSLFVFGDFTRYLLHRLMHALPFLWEFHKVHHSAQVLTPFTFYRVHPVESLLFGFRYALSAGIVTGIFVYFYGAGLSIARIAEVNAIVFIAHLLGDNLRHSHVHLSYPDWLERILISPAQHQYHHTLDGSQKNFGGVLALWDVLFSSLRLSSRDDVYHWGIYRSEQYNSVFKLLFLPVIKLLRPIFYHEKSH